MTDDEVMNKNQAKAAAGFIRADGSPIRILVVDDEPSLSELVSMVLRYEGCETKTAETGQQALQLIRDFNPDAVVLDIMLPDLDGIQILTTLRAHDNNVPVLFLTAKDSLEDRLAGLTVGGDDYVTKPFSLEEVVARIRALIRRSTLTMESVTDPKIRVGDLLLDEDTHDVTRGDEPIHLTSTEFELLRFLMLNSNRVVSKAQILDRVWNYDFDGKSSIVEIYISYLRKKIDHHRKPMIHTVRGAGYILKPASNQG